MRLTVDGETHTAPLRIDLDPRLVAEGVTAADIRAQHAFVERVGDVQARAGELAREVRDWRGYLEGLVEDGGDAAAAAEKGLARLEALDARLSTKRGGRYQQPMLTSQLSYLARNASRGDQAPNNHAIMRLEALEKELESCEAAFAEIDAPKPPESDQRGRGGRSRRRR